MNKVNSLVLILTVACTAASTSAQKYLKPDKAILTLPAQGASKERFVPEGWEIVSQADGDLDGDGNADATLSLGLTEDMRGMLGNFEGSDSCESPAYIVVVLFAKPAGAGYERFAANGKLFPPTCEDARPDVTIKNGVLIVNHNWRDGWAVDTTFRFRYDLAEKRLNLIGFDFAHYSRSNVYEGAKTSDNYLTGQRILYAKDDVRRISTFKEVRRERITKAHVSFENTLMGDPDSDDFKPFR
jgi:hypothetical protein